MKLVNSKLDLKLEIKENIVDVIVVEDKQSMVSVVSDLWCQCNGKEGDFVLSNENIIKIDWKDILVAIPSFFIVVMMPLSYSITTGIQFGFIFYVIVNLVNGKGKKVSPIIYLFVILFDLCFSFLQLF